MKVRYGWNTAMGRLKFDVEVDEADLPRILTECGVDVAVAPTMAARDVYAVLYCTAVMFSSAAQLRVETDPATHPAIKQEIVDRRAEREKFLQRYRPVPEPAE